MGELSKGSGISSIRGGDFELGASGVSAVASSDVVVEDITPICLIPFDDSDELVIGVGIVTITRSTIGTFEDRDDGLVKTAAIDVARFERQGILIEGASENLLLHSEDFSNSVWLQSRYGPSNAWTKVDNTTDILDPEGTNTATKLTANASPAPLFARQSGITITANGDFTPSIFVFIPSSNGWGDWKITVDLSDAVTVNSSTQTLFDRWVRVGIPMTNNATTSHFLDYVILHDGAAAPVTGNVVYIDMVQGEELPFASSYIKTVASTVTKTDEDTDIDAANIPAPTADYTVSMEVDAIGFDSSLSQVLFNVAGETSRRIAWNTTTGAIEATHGAVTSVSTSTFSAGDRVKISFAVDATNQTLFINGVQEDQDAKGTVTGTATAINIGHQAGVNQAFSHIKPLRINDVALTAAQVGAL